MLDPKVGDQIERGGKRGIVTRIDHNGVHVNFEGEMVNWGASAPVIIWPPPPRSTPASPRKKEADGDQSENERKGNFI